MKDLNRIGMVARRFTAAFAATVAVGWLLSSAPCCFAQNDRRDGGSEKEPRTGETEIKLASDQSRLADRYERLEQIITRLAELSASSDPHRANLLREALAEARERDVAVRLNSVVRLLENGRLATAARNQDELSKDLRAILDLLLKENRGEELVRQREWLKKQLKEVGRIIRSQRGVKARTEGGDDAPRLAKDQARIAGRTGELGDTIEAAQEAGKSPGAPAGEATPNANDKENDGGSKSGDADEPKGAGEPSDAPNENSEKGGQAPGEPRQSEPGQGEQGQSKPGQGKPGQGEPGQPSGNASPSESDGGPKEFENLRQRIRAAQEKMEQARKKLESAEREPAADAQEKALRELESAKAELERVLRQLREEEMERTLELLEARFRKMLDLQLVVYEGTVRIDAVPEAKRNHKDEIEAGRLSRREAAIVHEANKALTLLQEEGSSVAFPEAVEQMRADMQQIVGRLARVQVGALTQGLEEDVIEALEESIAAIQKALQELDEDRTPPGESPPPGEPQEPPLVDSLAELKMIRSLQARVKRRTERYAQMVDGAQAEAPELIDALSRLAERQRRIQQATHDLTTRKNR